VTTRHTTKRWRRGSVLGAATGVLAVGMVVTAIVGLTLPHTRQTGGPPTLDLAGHPVQVDGPAPAPSASATPSGVGRFAAPSVGLDVPLGALSVVDDVVEPPGFTSAYWVRNLGVAPADAAHGTVFVAMHSLRGGGVGPGNALIDVAAGRPRIATGAAITVDDVRYRVTRTETVGKGDIHADAEVWANTPGRLVVITCLQRADGERSVSNVVVEAVRA